MKRAKILIGCAAFVLASSVQAQTVVLGPEGVARSEGLGRAFQTFSIFGGTPGVAAAKFYSDFDLNNFQFPITHTFVSWISSRAPPTKAEFSDALLRMPPTSERKSTEFGPKKLASPPTCE